MSEPKLEVYRAHREAQLKHTYFLLAAAGAGIAICVNQTRGATLAWSQVPLALAVASWALSFYFGCRHLDYAMANLLANLEMPRIEAGQHPEIGMHPQKIAAASEGIRLAFETNSDRASRFHHWQFRSLILGGVLYVVWHVLEMYLRS
jgi:hypothetical protein